jgi:CRP/FNR family transcriptional regulator, cyclic AMP receptor protein
MTIDSYLRQTDIFYELTNLQIELIASISQERTYNAGDVIFEENSAGDELYVIGRGEVEIFVSTELIGRSSAGPQSIATLRRGQCFGEVALVDEGLRSAGARAAEKGTLLVVIPRDRLMRMCETYHDLGFRLMRNLAADLAMKIRNTDLQMRAYLAQINRLSNS